MQGLYIYIQQNLEMRFGAPEHQYSCSFEKIKINTYKFKKILRKITDVYNNVSHNHVKNQLQILCISSYMKKTKVWIWVSTILHLQILSDLSFLCSL